MREATAEEPNRLPSARGSRANDVNSSRERVRVSVPGGISMISYSSSSAFSLLRVPPSLCRTV